MALGAISINWHFSTFWCVNNAFYAFLLFICLTSFFFIIIIIQVYTAASTADSEGISNWAYKRLDETATWVEIPGTKSLALNKVLQEGPALIVFAPDNPYYSANDPFTLVSSWKRKYLLTDCKAYFLWLNFFFLSFFFFVKLLYLDRFFLMSWRNFLCKYNNKNNNDNN